MCKEYNGWSNYPTWAAALWMGNDPGSEEHYQEIVAGVVKRGGEVYDLAALLKNEFEENCPVVDGMWGDFMTWAVGMIDFHEIARAYYDQYMEDNPAEPA